jgi:hypothetical protein
MRRRIPNNRTLALIGVKARRLGDNPGLATAPTCSDSQGTIDCPTTIFEVRNPQAL